ncbi:hypothetical protein PACTADRAFT_50239 [Pachysolen tannophilus NRRL Y-2460]|uniref:Uncharacterized protein n=1 Tax=Pachysolen tannophilus NRRL Y-2460 TaxID=669874 RepID=A0A1E4TUS1_PACTA|nr:hypothetical protein PACTADRAFT_50239 [Pachysolen tannophilus NRRL Y-2460]
MSATYEQRKLLEQLMGKDVLYSLPRNYKSNYELHKEQKKLLKKSYHINGNPTLPNKEQNDLTANPAILNDRRICKSFLVGTCPYDIFAGTKQDFGRCEKLHLEKHKIIYQSLLAKNYKFDDFESEHARNLEAFINNCNKKIYTALRRLEHTKEEKEKLASITKELDAIDAKIGLMQQELELLIDNGYISKSIEVSSSLNSLAKQRLVVVKNVRDISENLGQSSQQKLQVCEVCGAYLSRLDNDRRLADHFIGKVHLGYAQVRQELEELRVRHGQEKGIK